MSEEEELRVRYDRQVRLWGNATQQALQSCHLSVLGVAGAAGEVLKNLVLSGVGRVELVDDASTQPSDLLTSHLLRGATSSDHSGSPPSRAAVMLGALSELNPFVAISAKKGAAASRDTLLSAVRESTVLMLSNAPLDTILTAARVAADAGGGECKLRHFVSLSQFGPLSLCLLVPIPRDRTAATDVGEQVRALLTSPSSLRRRPKPFQMAVLMMTATFPPAATFPQKVRLLLDLRAELGLIALEDADVQIALDILCGQRGLRSDSGVLDCSVVGGVVSQQLVAAISAGSAGSGAAGEGGDAKQLRAHLWSACSTVTEHMECYVGDS